MKCDFCKVLVVVLLLQSALNSATAQRIATVAGTGEQPSGADGIALRTAVGGPFGVCVGPDNKLYVCETIGHRVRRLDPDTGRLHTVAGSGRRGYSGDGQLATSAALDEPYEVRFDRSGNMFFVEMKNHVVRRVDGKTGAITTVAGTGNPGFSGDGGPATQATMNRPHSIALDATGAIYICDIGNHRVRRVDPATGIITTFAGTGKRGPTPNGAPVAATPLNGPRALDYRDGSLFLALREGNAVYRIDLSAQSLHHLAGTGRKGYTGDGGPAVRATLSGPKGIAIGPGGDIFLADTESHTIRVIRAASGIIETVVGTGKAGDGPEGPAGRCRLNRPHGVFVTQAGTLYVGDSSNHKVRAVDLTVPKGLR